MILGLGKVVSCGKGFDWLNRGVGGLRVEFCGRSSVRESGRWLKYCVGWSLSWLWICMDG